MGNQDLRPPLWVGHVALETNRLEESAQFMLTIGMRPVHKGSEVAIFELRGGTHLAYADRSYAIHRSRLPIWHLTLDWAGP